ncbi:hypothetical protein ACNCRI_004235 [Escherichia coli]
MSIKNDGHYFCRAGGNRPDGLNEPVTFLRRSRHYLPERSKQSVTGLQPGKAIRNRRIFLIAVCWRCVKQVKLIIQPEKGGLNEMVPFCHKLEEKLMTSNRCREIKTPPEHIIADYILRFMKNNKEAKLYEAMSRLESKIKLFVADGHDELHIRALLNQAAHSHTKESLKQACERICN